MAKKKVAVAKRSHPKTTSGSGKQKAPKTNPTVLAPVIYSTDPEAIPLSKDNFWFTVMGSNLSNPAVYSDTNVLVFTDDDTQATHPIPNDKVSFSDSTPGQFVIKVTGISRRSIELRGTGKLKITILAGRTTPPFRRKDTTYETNASIPD